jgi:hypothetical protein
MEVNNHNYQENQGTIQERLDGVLNSVSPRYLFACQHGLSAPTLLFVQTTMPTKPNILVVMLVVMTDDQQLDELRVMAKIEALMDADTTFTNSYASFPLCCPSRDLSYRSVSS